MMELAGDLKRACRRLRAAPSFTVIAVGTLALGIAATSAIFTVVEAVILRPLPYREPGQLVRITSDFEKLGVPDVGLSASELFDYRERSDVFEEVAAIWPITANLTGQRGPSGSRRSSPTSTTSACSARARKSGGSSDRRTTRPASRPSS